MKRLGVILCVFLASAVSAAPPAQLPARGVFDELSSLVGTWKSTSSNTVATYSTIANGSTLIETWTMSPTRQSMTVYTMDGDRLLATHYCPQGNAPRLRLVTTDKSNAHHFIFLDGANLQDPTGSHEHSFWVRLDTSGTLIRSETYVKNSAIYNSEQDQGGEESFVRIAAKKVH